MRHSWLIATLVIAAGILRTSAMADPIVWQTPQTISGDSNVSTTGALVYAINFGDSGAATETINGVTFAAFNAGGSSGSPVTHGNVSLSGIDPNFNGAGNYTGSGSAPYTGLSSSYQAMLGQVVFAKSPGESGGPQDLVLTMGGLASGVTYQFEAWSNDSRASQGGSLHTRSETITDGTSTSNPLFFNTSPTASEGGLGSFILGTFKATGPSEMLTFTGDPIQGDAQINGFQLRALTPEPTALMLSSVGAVCLFAGFLRRRLGR